MGTDGDLEWWWNVLYNNMDELEAHRVMSWLAYPLQHPGAKLATYMLWWGPSGIGKNRLMVPLSKIYGRNFGVITKEDIVMTLTR